MRQMFILICMGFLGISGIAQADVISERKAGFKGNVADLKKIQGAIGTGDLTAVADAAMSIADWSARMIEYFPEGSDAGNTNARAEIWLDFDDFTNRAKNAETAALELANLAMDGNTDMLMDGLKTLSGTCKACHASYKN